MLLAVDALSLFFRAYYSMGDLRSKSGFPTGALYGFGSYIVNAISTYKPEYVVIGLEGSKCFRKEISSDYKSNRAEADDDIIEQIHMIENMLDAMGVRGVKVDFLESDDIMGTYANISKNMNMDCVIMTSDKDIMQTVCSKVKIYDISRKTLVDESGVFERFGVRPDQIIDYLCLVGDSSDCIAGIDGIGKKTAQKLLSEFDSIDGIYDNIYGVSIALRKKMPDSIDDFEKAKKLVSLRIEEDLVPDIKELRFNGFNNSSFEDFLKLYNMDSLIHNFKKANKRYE